MVLSRPARGIALSTALCLAIGVSALLRIPIPTQWVAERLREGPLAGRPGELALGAVWFRWGTATLTVEQLRYTESEGLQARADRVQVQLEILPPTGGLVGLNGLRLVRPEVELDAAWLAGLASAPAGDGDSESPAIPIGVRDGRLRYRDSGKDLDLPLEIRQLTALIESRTVAASGDIAAPWGGELRFTLRGSLDFSSWEGELEYAAENLDLSPKALKLPWRESAVDRVELHARATGKAGDVEHAWLNASATGWRGSLTEPTISWRKVAVSARGELGQGILLDIRDGEVFDGPDHVPIAVSGFLRSTPAQPMRLRFDGTAGPIEMDASFQDFVDRLDSSAGSPVAAFEPRGRSQARFHLGWSKGSELQWAAVAPMDGFGLTYRGFLEDDGEKPAFPYPIHADTAQIAAGGKNILLEMEGTQGDGKVTVAATLALTDGEAEIAADGRIRGLALDNRVASYANGTPDLAEIIRELGAANGGNLDLDLAVRRPMNVLQVDIEIQGKVRDAPVRPRFLPVQGLVAEADFEWRPGRADFEARAEMLNGDAHIQGRLSSTVLRGPDGTTKSQSEIAVTGVGHDLAPSPEDTETLCGYLDLPSELEDLRLSGGNELSFAFRRPAQTDPAHVLVGWRLQDAGMRSEAQDVALEDCDASLSLFRCDEQFDLQVADAHMRWLKQPVELGLGIVDDGTDRRGSAILGFDPLDLSDSLLRGLPAGLEFDPGERFSCGGQASGWVGAELTGKGAVQAAVRLKPLALTVETAPGRRETARVTGTVRFAEDVVSADSLIVEGHQGGGEVRDLRVELGEAHTQIAAEIESLGGFDAQGFSAFVGPSAWAALQRLGLTGKLGADSLRLTLRMPKEGDLELQLAGRALLREISLEGPPTIRSGAADLVIESFDWKGGDGFDAVLRLEAGEALAGGVRLREAHGRVHLTPDELTLTELSASALGGTVTTAGASPSGEAEQGLLRLGLSPKAPLRVLVHLREMSLGALRRELNLGEGIAGDISARLDFSSETPSPLDYTGTGQVWIRNGVLGSVPVLDQLWKTAGLRTPQFDAGEVQWFADAQNAPGVVRIASFKLDHTLLSVEGEGWVGLDGYLRMKATVRTFSIFGRLPGIKQFVDLVARQNVRGPFDAPRISQRALSELSGSKSERYPFPLWKPATPRVDWLRSPALPRRPDEGAENASSSREDSPE